MTKKAGSKRNTKIIKECLINAPVTNYNMAAYHYNFEHRQYELANPMGYKYAKMYPRTKIKLVMRDIQSNVKNFPKPTFYTQDRYIIVGSLLVLLTFLSWHFFREIFNTKSNHNLRLQYFYTYSILLIISLLGAYLYYIHKRTIYMAKLHSKKKIMTKLFEEINLADFPQGDIELVAGQFAAWFIVRIFSEEYYFSRPKELFASNGDSFRDTGGHSDYVDRSKGTIKDSTMQL